MPDEGIEPPTFGLQNRCSTAELIRHFNGLAWVRTVPCYPIATRRGPLLAMFRSRRQTRRLAVRNAAPTFVIASSCMPGEHVRVRVEGNADLAVSEPFAGDLHVNAGCERVCRVVCRKSWEGGTAGAVDQRVGGKEQEFGML